jgi:formate hydrogenlyase subunit 3/multisubunit Na+/H+ antiporter MnhD subunit
VRAARRPPSRCSPPRRIAAGSLLLAFGEARAFPAAFEIGCDSATSPSRSAFKFDDLAALMLTVVGVVGLCIHVFSLGYMHDDGARAGTSAGSRSSCSRWSASSWPTIFS